MSGSSYTTSTCWGWGDLLQLWDQCFCLIDLPCRSVVYSYNALALMFRKHIQGCVISALPQSHCAAVKDGRHGRLHRKSRCRPIGSTRSGIGPMTRLLSHPEAGSSRQMDYSPNRSWQQRCSTTPAHQSRRYAHARASAQKCPYSRRQCGCRCCRS